GGGDGEDGLERFSRGVIGDSDRVISNEGMLWRALIERKMRCFHDLRWFLWLMWFWMVHLEELEKKRLLWEIEEDACVSMEVRGVSGEGMEKSS
ncbi:hypothetical protein Tco_1060792, partial [Tanacetum coccineum]